MNFPPAPSSPVECCPNAAIRDIELVRARQALGYLKAKIGNAGMRDLLQK